MKMLALDGLILSVLMIY